MIKFHQHTGKLEVWFQNITNHSNIWQPGDEKQDQQLSETVIRHSGALSFVHHIHHIHRSLVY